MNLRIRRPLYIFPLNPDYVAARSLRSLRSNYFKHRNVNSQLKNNLCEKAKADTQTLNSRPGRDTHYNRNGRFYTKDGLFVLDGLSV